MKAGESVLCSPFACVVACVLSAPSFFCLPFIADRPARPFKSHGPAPNCTDPNKCLSTVTVYGVPRYFGIPGAASGGLANWEWTAKWQSGRTLLNLKPNLAGKEASAACFCRAAMRDRGGVLWMILAGVSLSTATQYLLHFLCPGAFVLRVAESSTEHRRGGN